MATSGATDSTLTNLTPKLDGPSIKTNITTMATVGDAASISVTSVTTQQDTELQTRLEDLPRELYDLIQDFTFRGFIEGRSGEYNLFSKSDLNRHVADLKILQLNRATRGQYAEAFYQRCTLVVWYHRHHCGLKYRDDLLQSIAKEHLPLIGMMLADYRELKNWDRDNRQFNQLKVALQRLMKVKHAAEVCVKIWTVAVEDNGGLV